MLSLNDRDLLIIWENTHGKSLIEKGLVILAVACPEYTTQQIATFSIGERDARLLQLRENLFGHRLQNSGKCPSCEQLLEWEMDTRSLKLQAIKESIGPDEIKIPYGSYTFYFRLPNSEDLLHVIHQQNVGNAVIPLIKRCLVKSDLTDVNPDVFPDELIQIVEKIFSERDPQADISIRLSCPQCTHEWQSVFDILGYLWAEIQERVKKLYQEIVLLARYFSWSENDILNLSRFRRQLYLRMIQV